MRVKILSRNPSEFRRETKKDIQKVPRNYDPSLHPFEAPREYTRALNAAKLERVFAKPFVGSLDGHSEGVHCLCKHPKQLSTLLSGAYDGELKLWNLPRRECTRSIQAHDGFVRGICCHPNGEYFFSCGDDKIIKQWSMASPTDGQEEPVNSIVGKHIFQSIDHHWKNNMFATAGETVDIWDEERSSPVRTFTWGVDSIGSVKFNPVETHLLGATAQDRSIILYDMRGANPLRKVILKLRSNTIAWNPMEAFIFTAANEDYNLYTFDMRNLSEPLNVHMDHVSAVLDVDYSPTGKEFVSGSYDKTIRIFSVDKSHSREIYHTKRMQRVVCVKWSSDNKYLLSGSDEMNIRVWKAKASEKLGALQLREKAAFNYNEKLKEKFAHHPHVKRIIRHRHIPRPVYTAAIEHRTIKYSQKRKEANRRAHSKAGAVPYVGERKKSVVGERK
ncbi:DDB1- and CUL4-associated factor 13-like [Lineus longissimus]|uniref:DDB1- and CUL4-associated factor 13-like n=1 Tax=Lineus longissimus TaxID=88925 RepID=UPI002B4D267A